MTNNIEIRRRRLKYRTSHTGTKETDILLGSFVEVFIESLDESEIQDFEDLLSIGNDPLVFNWIVSRESAPKEFDTPLLKKIQNHVVERDIL
ncbi:MAG: succinate dehydrogenase assembly factor 2 [Gammaproteobacteria bacterium]|nr:succinate dehydrogenase assembly factor 2 [Gammaproteobacteria bacterium]